MSETLFESVWDALEATPADAANMRARSELLRALQDQVRGWGVSTSSAATRLGLPTPRFEALAARRIDEFELDALVALLERAGLALRVEVLVA